METNTNWLTTLDGAVANILTQTSQTLPSLLAAVLVVFAGWLLARIVRGALRRLANAANQLLERLFRHGLTAGVRLTGPAIVILGEVAFWIVILLSLTVAARIGGFPYVTAWLNQIITHLPNLIVGFVIIVLGYLASGYVGKSFAKDTSDDAGISLLGARLAQGLIIIATLIVGLDQFGIEVTFLVTLMAVIAGGVLAGFSLAFGLGARDHIRNLIGAHNVRRDIHAGLTIRIDDIEGEILEITPTRIALDTGRGRLLIPASAAEDRNIEILTSAGEKANG